MYDVKYLMEVLKLIASLYRGTIDLLNPGLLWVLLFVNRDNSTLLIFLLP